MAVFMKDWNWIIQPKVWKCEKLMFEGNKGRGALTMKYWWKQTGTLQRKKGVSVIITFGAKSSCVHLYTP